MKNKKITVTLLLTVLCVLLLSACGSTKSDSSKKTTTESTDSLQESSTEVYAMDTYMTLKAYGDKGEDALEAAKTEIERLDALWSVGQEDSEIAKLNKDGSGKVSDETMELIQCALKINKQSGGAFDITIYPLMDLWGFTTQNYYVPTDDEIDEILSTKVGSDKVEINTKTNEVTLKDGAQIDLGGIAKGYTSQKVAEIFDQYGVEHGVISLGGNVQAIGNKTDGSRWKVGIQAPNDDFEDYVGTYEAKDESVITSGGYERYFEQDGKTYQHILDPATGKPSESDLISVTIVSKNGMKADCLSTTLFVLGREKAEEYWKEHSDEFECILVDQNDKVYVTEGAAEHFSSDYDYTVIKK